MVVAPVHAANESSQVSDRGRADLMRSNHPAKHQTDILTPEYFRRQSDSRRHGCYPIKAVKYGEDRQTVRRGIECLR